MLPCALKNCAGPLRAALPLVLLAGVLLLPGCFSSCTGKPAPPAAPAVPTPATPMPAPAVQTPPTPAPGPAVQTPPSPFDISETPESPPEEAAGKGLTLEGMRAIQDGMTYAEVKDKIGSPGALIAGTDKASTVYRWNEAGLSFLARFENGKLTRKSIITAQGEEVPVDKDFNKTIDKDLYDGIHPGMSYDEVMKRIGIEAQPISKGKENVNIYTWRDASGSSFTARFENGKLVRKTGLYVAKAPAGKGAPEEASAEGESAADQTPESGAKAAGSATAENAAPPAGSGRTEAAGEPAPPGPRKSRVTIAGASRREREAENGGEGSDSSYRPRAQLPRNVRKLREGSYEIRLHNTAESRVRAAVVSPDGATEVTIPPGGTQSVFVNQGDYTVQFIYDDDPYTLHQGGVIPIGQWLTDMEVFLFGGSYDVQVLDHSTDRKAPATSLPARNYGGRRP